MINTLLLNSQLQSIMNNIETICKTYDPNVHSLSSFQSSVKQTLASQLANAHTQHVLTASVQGTANVATVPSMAPVVGVLM